MKQCPFCGTQWNGKGPCPSCGVKPETPEDDSLFRPPENGTAASSETPPEFEVKELLRWEPSPESEKPGENEPEEEGEVPVSEKSEEGSLRPRRRFKRWQKLTAAAVAVVIVVTAAVVKLWPQSQALPAEPAFFVQDDTLMVLPAAGKPQQVTEYLKDMEYHLWASPDQKSFVWLDSEKASLKLLPPQGEAITMPKTPNNTPIFSKDSRYLYYSSYDGGNESVLYQYEIATGEEQKVGVGSTEMVQENGSLIAVNDYSHFAIYDVKTLEEKLSQDTRVIWMRFAGDQLYYLEQAGDDLYTCRLCCWQDGQTEVLMENVKEPLQTTDGILYLLCPSGEEVSMYDLVENDMGTKGEAIMSKLEGQTTRIPDKSLYYFKDGELHLMGEKLGKYAFVEINQGALVTTIQYQSPEETKFSLAQIMGAYGTNGDILLSDVAAYMDNHWPSESSLDYLAIGGRLVHLPENVPQAPYAFRVAGDWMCIYNRSNEASECGLWMGRIEGEEVVSQNFYTVSDIDNFVVIPQGKLYYWGGQGGQFVGPIYENGVPIVTDANLPNIQVAEDGTLYFLSGSSASPTLKRIAQGNLEMLAENVNQFTAFTRDYALYLQPREDTGWDLFAYQNGGTAVVAEQVSSLLPIVQSYPQLLSPYSYSGNIVFEGMGGVDNSIDVTTEIVG